jgi:hypothetical protein
MSALGSQAVVGGSNRPARASGERWGVTHAPPSFRAVPHVSDKTRVATYRAKGDLRVDFLTPNRGRETDRLQTLPAFGTDAQPMRFLDYLIRDPQPAAILHSPGIYAHVPAPERFAVHKLIVARRRNQGTGKADKDLTQAEALLSLSRKSARTS